MVSAGAAIGRTGRLHLRASEGAGDHRGYVDRRPAPGSHRRLLITCAGGSSSVARDDADVLDHHDGVIYDEPTATADRPGT
jgi:hypothetical protein